MISENVGVHYLPAGVHFQDKSGKYAFRDAVTTYLQDFTCRVCANVLCPHGDESGSNNTTETQNKKTHQH